jgi:hypothetical protein
MAKKKKIPQIVKDIRNYTKTEINWATQKLISYSQFSMFNECPKKWALQYKEGHKQFNSTIHTVFGSALHLVIQHYLTVMYDKSMVEADKINTSEMFGDALREEYKLQYKKNNNTHFSTPEEIREFYEQGIEIIRDFAKNKTKHFSKRGWFLIGCEIPLSLIIDPRKPNVLYQGYLDIVMYHEPTNTIKIIDIKSSTSGWNDKAKKDENKQFQLILYKKFLSDVFNFPIDNITIEFFIVKRKLPVNEDFIIKRIQIFSPPSGKIKVNKATQAMDKFIEEAFDNKGFQNTEHTPQINDNCKWCPFYKIHHCTATYK